MGHHEATRLSGVDSLLTVSDICRSLSASSRSLPIRGGLGGLNNGKESAAMIELATVSNGDVAESIRSRKLETTDAPLTSPRGAPVTQRHGAATPVQQAIPIALETMAMQILVACPVVELVRRKCGDRFEAEFFAGMSWSLPLAIEAALNGASI
ncbi:hypothetical protein PHYSODRAFT_330120 [Phytophthora sojae]|uniref:Uncharacterized protein n=1 Tax=Phytophthora sojae (strain P6497) TaxID=1094619 RepID=G4Z4W3_PHYSP|nr:hypothetical protein PHYSODRAFT_330120 [Phytophthora sojae]EGZ22292.1 hypothetical protein PHYSODRAFT_330120 [Phytophthora sojae]|eukprot:XP_009525009.1 hypothetical protein PHYSODRAFT_330120 [Phytophthora sojae]